MNLRITFTATGNFGDDRRGREKEEKGEGLKTKGEKCVEISLVGGRLEILADK